MRIELFRIFFGDLYLHESLFDAWIVLAAASVFTTHVLRGALSVSSRRCKVLLGSNMVIALPRGFPLLSQIELSGFRWSPSPNNIHNGLSLIIVEIQYE